MHTRSVVSWPRVWRLAREEPPVRTGRIHVALGALLCGLTTWVGLPTDVYGQDKPAGKPPMGGAPVLPVPDPPFRGVIGRTTKDSKPDFPKAVTAPKGAPNILLIMTDDTGFGASSTFGGPIPTPTLDRVAFVSVAEFGGPDSLPIRALLMQDGAMRDFGKGVKVVGNGVAGSSLERRRWK